jgi:outer membrane receptor protein involved in Fe transport
MKTPTPLLSLLFLPLLSAALLAQSAPPSIPAREGVVELSAFVITSEKDLGYAATSSLAGTRIRTELKDLANPISVVTREFNWYYW